MFIDKEEAVLPEELEGFTSTGDNGNQPYRALQKLELKNRNIVPSYFGLFLQVCCSIF